MDKQEIKNDGVLRRILEGPEIRKIDKESRTVEFVASDNSVDSYGTVIPVDKWDLTRYQGNGVVGYMHDIYWSDDPDNIIGKGRAWTEDDKLIVAITFEPAELNEKADKIFRKIQFGSLNGVSVGFAPTTKGHWGDERDGESPDVYYYDGQQLLEVSIVNIPSNANALKRSFGEVEMEHIRAEKEACKPKKKKEGDEEGCNDDEDENKPKIEDPDSKDRSLDEEINIRLTIARAKATMAKNQKSK